ncbi:hypothetical protein HDU93_005484, partial [Gonapodya sp. JEL0774]
MEGITTPWDDGNINRESVAELTDTETDADTNKKNRLSMMLDEDVLADVSVTMEDALPVVRGWIMDSVSTLSKPADRQFGRKSGNDENDGQTPQWTPTKLHRTPLKSITGTPLASFPSPFTTGTPLHFPTTYCSAPPASPFRYVPSTPTRRRSRIGPKTPLPATPTSLRLRIAQLEVQADIDSDAIREAVQAADFAYSELEKERKRAQDAEKRLQELLVRDIASAEQQELPSRNPTDGPSGQNMEENDFHTEPDLDLAELDEPPASAARPGREVDERREPSASKITARPETPTRRSSSNSSTSSADVSMRMTDSYSEHLPPRPFRIPQTPTRSHLSSPVLTRIIPTSPSRSEDPIARIALLEDRVREQRELLDETGEELDRCAEELQEAHKERLEAERALSSERSSSSLLRARVSLLESEIADLQSHLSSLAPPSTPQPRTVASPPPIPSPSTIELDPSIAVELAHALEKADDQVSEMERELAEVGRRYAEATGELQRAGSDRDHAVRTMEDLKREVDRVTARLAETEGQRDGLAVDLDNTRAELSLAAEREQRSEDVWKEMEPYVRALEEERNEARREVEEARWALEQRDGEVEEFKCALASAEEKLVEVEGAVREWKERAERVEQLIGDVEGLRGALKGAERRCGELGTDLEAWRDRAIMAESRAEEVERQSKRMADEDAEVVIRVRERLENVEAELERANRDVLDLRREVESVVGARARVEEALRVEGDTRHKLEGDLARVNAELDTTRTRLVDVENFAIDVERARQLVMEREAELSKLQNELGRVREAATLLESRLSVTTAERDGAVSTVIREQELMRSMETELVHLRSRLAETVSDRDSARTVASDAERRVTEAREEANRWADEASKEKMQKNRALEECEELRIDLRLAEGQVKAKELELAQTNARLTEAYASLQHAREEIAEMQAAKDNLTVDLSEADSELMDVQRQLEEEQLRKEEAERVAEGLREELNGVQEVVVQLRREIEELQEVVRDKEVASERLEKEKDDLVKQRDELVADLKIEVAAALKERDNARERFKDELTATVKERNSAMSQLQEKMQKAVALGKDAVQDEYADKYLAALTENEALQASVTKLQTRYQDLARKYKELKAS